VPDCVESTLEQEIGGSLDQRLSAPFALRSCRR